ncbi:MAG: hypothetical protein F6J90_10515 [Moorea sp. SIOASIH]|nr:hypothetical protein [Moorena sp. SIOASIH]NEO36735.1 hypothetical protein [Moorena sp. SIOASIH]
MPFAFPGNNCVYKLNKNAIVLIILMSYSLSYPYSLLPTPYSLLPY